MIGLYEFYKISEKMGAKPLKIIGILLGAFNFLSFIEIECGATVFLSVGVSRVFMITAPFIIFALAMLSKKENSIKNAVFTYAGIIYAVLPFALLNQVPYQPGILDGKNYEPMLVLGIIFLIWSNDTFAYLGGSLFGKNKMIERVSPGKTWEGTIIGVLITFGLSFLFNILIFDFNDYTWMILGIVVPILATIGDLVESKLKREAGVKDSGSIMPGHGGVLDRFDSLIFVSPFVFVLFKLV